MRKDIIISGSGEQSSKGHTVFESNLACQDLMSRLCEGKNNGCPLPVL